MARVTHTRAGSSGGGLSKPEADATYVSSETVRTLVVATTAPAPGTPDTTLTIVVEDV